MIAIDTKMPKNCEECVSRYIRNMLRTCPSDLALDHRPSNCPLLEVAEMQSARLVTDIEPSEITEKLLAEKLAEFICSHRELIQFERDDAIRADDILLYERVIAGLNVVLPKGAKLNEQD